MERVKISAKTELVENLMCIALSNMLSNRIVNHTQQWGNTISVKDANGNTITDPNNIGLKNPYRYREYRLDNETRNVLFTKQILCPRVEQIFNC